MSLKLPFIDQRQTLLAILSVLLVSFCWGCSRPSIEPSRSTAPSQSVARKMALISITSDPQTDPQAVNMGLTFAGFCVDEGYEVAIFFNVKGTRLPTNSFPGEFKFLEHAPLKAQLKTLKDRGVELHVCPVCMKDLDISEQEIMEGAFVTSKPKLFAKLGPDTMVFTY